MPLEYDIFSSQRVLDFNDALSLGQYQGLLAGRKYGETVSLDTTDFGSGTLDLWNPGPAGPFNLTYIDIDNPVAIYVTSTDANATNQMIVYATIINEAGLKENVAIVHNLVGQTPTALSYTSSTGWSTSLFSRVFRAYNYNGNALAGDVYYSTGPVEDFTAGVPNATTQIQAYVAQADQQTLMSHFFVPDNYYALITDVHLGILNNGNTAVTTADIRLRVRNCDKTFLTKDTYSLCSYGSSMVELEYQFSELIPPCSDVKFTVKNVGRNATILNSSCFFKLFRTDRINPNTFGVL